jgi:hypothetical protein
MEPASILGSPPPPSGTVINIADTLPNLLYATAGGLLVSAQAQTPLDYSFNGFPKTVTYARDNILISNVTASDLSFLSNVVCAPVIFNITDNSQLTSLSGLNVWPWDGGPLQNITMLNNPLLLQPGFQPLGPLLQCESGSSPQKLAQVLVTPASCNQTLTTVNAVCAYINNGTCGATPGGPSVSKKSQLLPNGRNLG